MMNKFAILPYIRNNAMGNKQIMIKIFTKYANTNIVLKLEFPLHS